jgi:hypothetical protein
MTGGAPLMTPEFQAGMKEEGSSIHFVKEISQHSLHPIPPPHMPKVIRETSLWLTLHFTWCPVS